MKSLLPLWSVTITRSTYQRLASDLKGTPVIFGGINNFSPEMIEGLNATGISEDIDLVGNIELIKRLQSTVKKIYIVTDHIQWRAKPFVLKSTCLVRKHPEFPTLLNTKCSWFLSRARGIFSVPIPVLAVLGVLLFRDATGRLSSDEDWRVLNTQDQQFCYGAWPGAWDLVPSEAWFRVVRRSRDATGRVLLNVPSTQQSHSSCGGWRSGNKARLPTNFSLGFGRRE